VIRGFRVYHLGVLLGRPVADLGEARFVSMPDQLFFVAVNMAPEERPLLERQVVLRGMYGRVWKGRVSRATCLNEYCTTPGLVPTKRYGQPVINLGCARRVRRHLLDDEHKCGIYVSHLPAPLWGNGKPETVMRPIAEVVAWGSVAHYENGARAEAARIERIWFCPERMRWLPGIDVHAALRRRYGVPVSSALPPCYSEWERNQLIDAELRRLNPGYDSNVITRVE
jgi:hypothetical protein